MDGIYYFGNYVNSTALQLGSFVTHLLVTQYISKCCYG